MSGALSPALSSDDESTVEINVAKAMSIFSQISETDREETMKEILREANRQMIAAQQRANEADRHVIAVCEQAETFLQHQNEKAQEGEGQSLQGSAHVRGEFYTKEHGWILIRSPTPALKIHNVLNSLWCRGTGYSVNVKKNSTSTCRTSFMHGLNNSKSARGKKSQRPPAI